MRDGAAALSAKPGKAGVIRFTARPRRRGIGYERPGFAWLLNAPALCAIIVLAGYPIANSAYISLHRFNLKRPNVFAFVGLDNYAQLLQSPEFWSAFWVTVQFTVLVVALVVILGLAIALLLNSDFPGRNLLRTLVLVPWAIPPVVNGMMWQWIYDPKVGALNGLLLHLGLIDESRGWLSDPLSALLAIVFADLWNMVPLAVILLLAALQRIPHDLYEAAHMDGATTAQSFRYVTFPWLAQPLMIVLILQTMSAIRTFDIIYVLTAGGPGTATTTLTWKTYLTTFTSLNFGLGNAYAYMITLMTLALALVYFRTLYHRGNFER
jgi:multiple sugar transport system permease protein